MKPVKKGMVSLFKPIRPVVPQNNLQNFAMEMSSSSFQAPMASSQGGNLRRDENSSRNFGGSDERFPMKEAPKRFKGASREEVEEGREVEEGEMRAMKRPSGNNRVVPVVPDQDHWIGSDFEQVPSVPSFKKQKMGDPFPSSGHPGRQPHGKAALMSKSTGGEKAAAGRTDIEKLTPLMANVVVGGMVVNVKDANSFLSKKTGTETFVRHFVIKDDSGTVNCVLWSESRDSFLEFLMIGNLVELVGVDVRSKQEGEKFKTVRTTSPYELHISNSKGGTISQFSGETTFREPIVKQGWMPLNEVLQMGDHLIDAEVSILACIKKIHPVQEIVTKQDKRLLKREITVFDQTDSQFDITIWGHTASALDLMVPIQTVVLISDVKITSFRGSIQGSLGFSSFIDVNPDLLDGALLYDYAQTVVVEDDDDSSNRKRHFQPDLSKVTTKYTIKELETKILELKKGEGLQGYGVFLLSQYDIDSECESREVVSAVCKTCKLRFSPEKICSCDPESELPGYLSPHVSLHYDLPVSFMDETGSFSCKINPEIATTEFIGCSADEFLMLEIEKRTRLKVEKLFEKFKVYFKIQWADDFKEARIPRIVILGCQLQRRQQ